jgi:hypothetical protein
MRRIEIATQINGCTVSNEKGPGSYDYSSGGAKTVQPARVIERALRNNAKYHFVAIALG